MHIGVLFIDKSNVVVVSLLFDVGRQNDRMPNMLSI